MNFVTFLAVLRIRNDLFFTCSFIFCWIRNNNSWSGSRQKFRIYADSDPQHCFLVCEVEINVFLFTNWIIWLIDWHANNIFSLSVFCGRVGSDPASPAVCSVWAGAVPGEPLTLCPPVSGRCQGQGECGSRRASHAVSSSVRTMPRTRWVGGRSRFLYLVE